VTYLAIALTTIWLAGLLIFAGRFLNFARLLYNNLDPAGDFSRTGIFSSNASFYPASAQSIAPENLTEAGRQYRKLAIRDERLAMVWGLGGLAILACVLVPSQKGLAVATLVAVLAGFHFWARRVHFGRAGRIESVLLRGLDALMFLMPK
jgi:hypothetical protein